MAATTAGDDDDFGPWDIVESTDTACSVQPAVRLSDGTFTDSILGEPAVDAETICRFVSRYNADFHIGIAEAYLRIGRIYGIRGDVALCQAIVETGWFRFADGTSVTPDQNNYCGLGVTKRGRKGHSFKSVEEGVTAQLQHLYAYATRTPLPKGETMIDPRFEMVSRGCATTWHDLNGRWAANDRYGTQILDVYRRLLETANESVTAAE